METELHKGKNGRRKQRMLRRGEPRRQVCSRFPITVLRKPALRTP